MAQAANNNDGLQQYKDPARIPVTLRITNATLLPNDGNFSIIHRATVTKIPANDGQEEAPFAAVLKRILVAREDVNRLREIYLLRLLATTYQHKNIVQLLYTQRRRAGRHAVTISMVFRFMTSTLAQQRSELSRQRNLVDIKLYIWQLFSGLHHLKRKEIIHRDVKPGNILVEPATGQLKIADFGSAIRCSYPRTMRAQGKYAVTRPYRPPEILLEATEYNCNTDIWSAGCIFIELFVGETLFRANDGPNLLQLIYRTVGMPSKDDLRGMKVNLNQFVPANEHLVIWPMQGLEERLRTIGFRDANIPTDLFIGILQFDPNRRLNGSALLQHGFFDELFAPGTRRTNGRPITAISAEDRRRLGTGV